MHTQEQVKCIKPINTDTVHKICSGQVVLSLATAVKELIENALDAQSSVIDVRLKNYGVDLIEVSDNGTGVTEDNFAALTLKYHTSKLNEYSDLLGVNTFGFRGEALSSLCALATLIITTRHSNATYATKLEYDYKGNIIKKTPCSRQIGTTVTLTNLFSTLPVRQKEFHRNAKREFTKMTQILYAYCLISLNVKITCTNSTISNSKSVVVATQGSSSYKDNIACVFGSKQLQSILEIKPEYVSNIKDNIFKGLSLNSSETDNTVIIEDVEIDLSEDSTDADSEAKQSQNNSSQGSSGKSQGYINSICPVEFTGFISSCAHGSGRSSCDRQFYYINSRPCEPIKIMKLINEVYRQLNPHQYPFIFLNVSMDGSLVDVNLTPDKRKVFLAKEKLIMNVLKMTLGKLFEHIPSTLKVDVTDSLRKESNDNEKDKQKSSETFLQKFANTCKSKSKREITTNTNFLKRKSTSMLDFVSSKTSKIAFTQEDEEEEEEKVSSIIINIENFTNVKDNQSLTRDDENLSNHNYIKDQNSLKTVPYICKHESGNESNESTKENNSVHSEKEILYLECADKLPNTQIRNVSDIIEKSSTIYCKTKSCKNKSPLTREKVFKTVLTDKEDVGKQHRKIVTLKTSFNHVKSLFDIFNKETKEMQPNKVRFRSQINPIFNKKCEEELSKEISKSSFQEMTIVGQFNLGFIITQLKSDLFIIDQHATDEIYNFETLQKNTELTSQKLVCPQQLELTGVNEQILMDNLDIFKKNGFTFQIDALAPPTKRVKLLTLPMSKNWIFGKEDIEELLFMLRESPNENCRPSRVRAMFASRACRKSVMIGTALSKSDMKVLINHMGDINKPWNCPHGRPTIRHLVNLDMVHIKD